MKIEEWDDGLAIRIPQTIVDKLSLTAGDQVNIELIRHAARAYKGTISKTQSKLDLLRTMDK